MTSKEALKDLRHRIQASFITMPNVYDDTKIIEKDLEILEILKNKNVDVEMIIYCDYVETYNKALRPALRLTQEEFDLLKEWVNDTKQSY